MSNSLIIPVNSVSEIDQIPVYQYMCSISDVEPTIDRELLIHLLTGKPILDLSDEEYVHVIQLTSDAVEYFQSLIK